MLRINKDDLFDQKIEETKTNLRVILMDCFHKNRSEVIECDSIDTANSIMNYYWEHATDYLPDWWCKDIEIKRKNGVNTFISGSILKFERSGKLGLFLFLAN